MRSFLPWLAAVTTLSPMAACMTHGQGSGGALDAADASSAPTGARLSSLIESVQPAVVGVRIDGNASGTGFVVSREGHVLTANHVVSSGGNVTITLASGRSLTASVAAADPDADIALLEADLEAPVPVVELSTAGYPGVGEWVVVLGNPFGAGLTASIGIVSSTESALGPSDARGLIQTDAAVNPGNSGGPVVDLGGRVVGIATSRISSGQGIGFALPVARAVPLLEAHTGSRPGPRRTSETSPAAAPRP